MKPETASEIAERVTLIECPRDAWQGLAHPIPTAEKVAYLQALLDAGFRHLDAVSFVSPSAVPQMADSEPVLAALQIPPDAEIIGIVVNERGAERALATGRVSTLGYPHSVSAAFLARNQHQTPDASLLLLARLAELAAASGAGIVAYLSMAFGNPYNEPWSLDSVLDACQQIADCGVRQLSLADTVGAARPAQIAETFAAVLAHFPQLEIGLHLHARRDAAAALVRAAWNAGCRRFDSALGGLGGCPFAQDALVGNLATELVHEALRDHALLAPSLSPPVLSGLVLRSTRIAAGSTEISSTAHALTQETS